MYRKNSGFRTLTAFLTVAFASVNVFIKAAHSQVVYQEDFDGGKVGKFVTEFRHGNAVIEPDPGNRSGKSLRFQFQRANFNRSRESKGAEIRTKPVWGLSADVWTSFKIYFPSSTMGSDSKPVIIHQLHDIPDSCEDGRNPIGAIAYQNGTLVASYKGDTRACTKRSGRRWLYTSSGNVSLGSPLMNKWNTFIVHYKLSPTSSNGMMEVWVNGKKFSKTGINIGFNDRTAPFLKYGFYYFTGKSDFPLRKAYYDDIKVGKAARDVD